MWTRESRNKHYTSGKNKQPRSLSTWVIKIVMTATLEEGLLRPRHGNGLISHKVHCPEIPRLFCGCCYCCLNITPRTQLRLVTAPPTSHNSSGIARNRWGRLVFWTIDNSCWQDYRSPKPWMLIPQRLNQRRRSYLPLLLGIEKGVWYKLGLCELGSWTTLFILWNFPFRYSPSSAIAWC